LSQDNKALVMRLFNEVFTTRNLRAADDIMAEEYLEHAVEPFVGEEPGPVQGPSHAREVVAWLRA
jgi:predicted ester cyclase